MFPFNFKRQMTAFSLGFVLSAGVLSAQAKPLAEFSAAFAFQQQNDGKSDIKKLPPVNYTRSRDIDVRHVAIDLRFDWTKEQAYGNTVVTLAPFKATDKVYLDAAEMQINSVTLGDGTALKFNYKGGNSDNNLEILLPRVYQSGEELKVKVDYRTSYVNVASTETAIAGFGKGLRFIKPSDENPNKPMQIWSQGESEFNRYWFPSYDSPNDFRTTELKATVENKYTVISNGKLVETKNNGDGTRTFYWKMDVPYANYLTSIVVGEYAEIKNGEYEGIPVYAYAYKNQVKETTETTRPIVDMIRFFSEKTGVKYSYPKYAQTMVEDFGGGMENISATTMISELVKDERELLDENSDSLQAHELAHQWFGDYVTTRDWSNIWLNESFATYFDALYNEHKNGHDTFLLQDVNSNQRGYFSAWNSGYRRPMVTRYYADKDALFDQYAYPRGAAIIHMLRKHLGDDLFFKSLNRYLTQNAHKPVSTEQLRIAIEETSGQSMDWFFDQWLYKMGHPIFEVTKSYDAAAKKLTLNVKQTQKIDPKNEYPQTEFFQSWVEIEIDNSVQKVWIKPQAENVYTFDAASEPKIVNFDYNGTLIKELKFDKSLDELIYQASNSRDVIGRLWAIGELDKAAQTPSADKQKITSSLVAAATNESSWILRQRILLRLRNLLRGGAMPTGLDAPALKIDAATEQMLFKLAKDEKSLVRAEAVRILGATQDAKFNDLFVNALKDRSYTVVEAAAVALGQTKSPKAFELFSAMTKTNSWNNRIAVAGYQGLALLGDKRALDGALKTATDKNQPANVRTAALNVIGVTGKGDVRAFDLIFSNFKRVLEANDFRNLEQSLQSIIAIADPRGQQAFDMLREKFKTQPQIMGFITYYETMFKAGLNK